MCLPGHDCIPRASLATYLAAELDVSRLSDIFSFLWFAGHRGYIRPLHRQLLVKRSIIITEQADLHLVWFDQQIYLKPLPPFLLNHGFYSQHICNTPLYADACGMLVSYQKLVRYRSDYRIAVELGLLPEGVSWAAWSAFVVQVLPTVISRRYEYGELRLFRLNLIYRFCFGKWICGYHLLYTNFSSFFGRNFTWPLVIFAYLTTVLNAMQVILAPGSQSETVEGLFISVSFVVMMAIFGTLLLVACFFIGLLLYNLTRALRNREQEGRDDVERQAKCR